MRGRVTLAVRGFVGCVGVSAGVGVMSSVWSMQVLGWGALSKMPSEWLVVFFLRLGLAVVLVGLCVGAWRVVGLGFVVWMAVVVQLVAEVGFAWERVVEAWSSWGIYVASSLLLVWAGWQVLRGERQGRVGLGELDERQSIVDAGSEDGRATVLSYEAMRGGGSSDVAWVGTGLVFAVGMMLLPVVTLATNESNGMAADGVELDRRWRAVFAGVPLMGLVAVLGLASKAWGHHRSGLGAKRELWWIGVWMVGVPMVNMLVGVAVPEVAAWGRSGSWAGALGRMREWGLSMGLGLLRDLGPAVFFMMMVWPAMTGGGGKRDRGGGE